MDIITLYTSEKTLNEIGLSYRKYSRKLSNTFIPFGIYVKLANEILMGYTKWCGNKAEFLCSHVPTDSMEEVAYIYNQVSESQYFKELNELRKQYLFKFYQEHPMLYTKATGV